MPMSSVWKLTATLTVPPSTGCGDDVPVAVVVDRGRRRRAGRRPPGPSAICTAFARVQASSVPTISCRVASRAVAAAVCSDQYR